MKLLASTASKFEICWLMCYVYRDIAKFLGQRPRPTGLLSSAPSRSNPAAAFFRYWKEETMGMHFNPDSSRSYVGFHLQADQLAALDKARIEMRLSRSEFMREVVSAHLQRLQAAAN